MNLTSYPRFLDSHERWHKAPTTNIWPESGKAIFHKDYCGYGEMVVKLCVSQIDIGDRPGPGLAWTVKLPGQTAWTHQRGYLLGPQWELALRFVEADIRTPNDNPYGRASKATLKVYAAIVPILIHEGKARKRFGDFPYDLEHNGVTIGVGNLDPRHTKFSPGNNWCLQVERQYQGDTAYETIWSGLLLEGSGVTFRRIGVFYLLEEMINFFEDYEARTLDLI